MASTFTGFKLQGDLGKFGKTEISDIEGYAELPDGKVVKFEYWISRLKAQLYLFLLLMYIMQGSFRFWVGKYAFVGWRSNPNRDLSKKK